MWRETAGSGRIVDWGVFMSIKHPFGWFKTSPEIIQLAVVLNVRFSLSLRSGEDLLQERGVEVSHDTVRFWRNRFSPSFVSAIQGQRVGSVRSSRCYRHVERCLQKSTMKRSNCDGLSTMKATCLQAT